jgi:diketogulonate reductase-like aldo/keto reductase
VSRLVPKLTLSSGADISRLAIHLTEYSNTPTIHAAIDAGITLFDTDPAAEPELVKALSTYEGAENIGDLVIAHRVDKGAVDASELVASVHQSLAIMGVSSLDMIQLDCREASHASLSLTEASEALRGLQKEGKVKALGVRNVTMEQLKAIQSSAPVDVIANQMDLTNSLDQLNMVSHAQKNNMIILATSPFSGLDWKATTTLKQYSKTLLAANETGEVTVKQTAIYMLLNLCPDLAVVSRMENPAEVLENIAGCFLKHSEEMKTGMKKAQKTLINSLLKGKKEGADGDISKADMEQAMAQLNSMPLDKIAEQLQKLPQDEVIGLMRDMGFSPEKFGK